jgi:hypothetical protein
MHTLYAKSRYSIQYLSSYAQQKETPKMIYPKTLFDLSALFSECKCRLCGDIIEKYCKNLFLELAK